MKQKKFCKTAVAVAMVMGFALPVGGGNGCANNN